MTNSTDLRPIKLVANIRFVGGNLDGIESETCAPYACMENAEIAKEVMMKQFQNQEIVSMFGSGAHVIISQPKLVA